MIKLVIFDADETLWASYGYWVSLFVPPLKRVNDEIIDSEGKRITLFTGLRELLETLKDKGVLISLVSLNDSEPNRVMECLELFGLNHYFIYPQVNWNDKGQNIKNILELLEKNDGIIINCKEVLFVDDHLSNVEKANNACPGIVALHLGSDISKVTEIKNFL
ncbi:MAG: magnesium-dependent phosphatase-1 [Candidatus Jordarchaeum sp.]|uniref:magnesium-dependent phosphatase-1 n=1 Tax=Candidatus Jordarchaeum sp. TaxID=2823881 RepID=UPI004049BB74